MSIFIVAEIGINHNGSLKICKELIDIAKDCGCNAVKFQKKRPGSGIHARFSKKSKGKSLGEYSKRSKTRS